jgi:hypothetical protein
MPGMIIQDGIPGWIAVRWGREAKSERMKVVYWSGSEYAPNPNNAWNFNTNNGNQNANNKNNQFYGWAVRSGE